MNVLDHFSIPYQGLKNGMHQFKFDVDDDFFDTFDKPFVEKGSLEVNMNFDKRPSLSVAEFSISGEVEVRCDRCLQEFMLDIASEFILHIKFGDPQLNEDEVMFIETEASIINFAEYIYECICLSVPMINTHEDLVECDPEVVSRLYQSEEDEVSSKEEKPDVWQSLKTIKFDENESKNN
jgi:uncharacterized metal-binding protein YceD (DUF177 family)